MCYSARSEGTAIYGLLALLALLQLFPTNPWPAQPAPTPDLSAYVGQSWFHGFGLRVNADGSGEMEWRVYAWCRPGLIAPCDPVEGDRIINGGRATFVFDAMTADALAVRVLDSTDPITVYPGPLVLRLTDDGMLTVEQGRDGRVVRRLCGPGIKIPPAPVGTCGA